VPFSTEHVDMLTVIEHQEDWEGTDAVVLHVYADAAENGVCAFTTVALMKRPPEAELLHSPIGTPVQFAFLQARTLAQQLGVDALVINDPAKLFPPDERMPHSAA
jgi:hypothetical protein